MSRSLLPGVFLLLLAISVLPAEAETCSSSTLASADFAVARWCGDPPGTGTLRMVRRGGRAEEFLGVPLDTFREVVRTPQVARYVAEEVSPRFERAAVRAEVVPSATRQARRPPPAKETAPARVPRPRRDARRDEAGEGKSRVRRQAVGQRGEEIVATAAERRAARLRAAARRRAEAAERG